MRRLLSWANRGFFSTVDQGLFAGANFLVNILLARWLEPSQYGAFAVTYSAFLLLGGLHSSIITEPMVVFGAGKYSGRFKEYLGILIYCHLYLMIPVIAILAVSAFIFRYLYSHEVRTALLALILSGPLIILMWILRHALYVFSRPDLASLGSGAYVAFFTGTVWLLYWMNKLSPATAFLGMGVSAALVSLIFIMHLQPDWGALRKAGFSTIPKDHWIYGRWALGASVLSWLPGNIYFFIIPIWLGLEGVAALKALMNLILPMLNVISAFSLLFLPVFSRNVRTEPGRVARMIRYCLAFFLLLSVLYFFTVIIFKFQVLHLLYGIKYDNFSYLLPLFCLLPLSASLTAVMGSVIRAFGRPDKVLLSYVGSGIFSVTCGAALAANFGLVGALLGINIASLLTGITMSILYRKHFSGPVTGEGLRRNGAI